MPKPHSESGGKKTPQGVEKQRDKIQQDDAARYFPEDMDPGEAELLLAWNRHVEENYPNPDRVGCPGTEILMKIAARTFHDPDILYHIARCAPCSRELREFKYAAKHPAK